MVPERPGCSQAAAARHDLQRLHRRAGSRQHRERIGLGIQRIGRRRAGPVPSDAPSTRQSRGARPKRRMSWSSGRSPLNTWPTSNSATSVKPRLALACAARDQAGQQARPHVGEVGRDRVGERKLAPGRRRTVRPRL